MCYSMHYLKAISHVGEINKSRRKYICFRYYTVYLLSVLHSISVIGIKDLIFYLTIWFLVFILCFILYVLKLATYCLYLSKNIKHINKMCYKILLQKHLFHS